MASVLLCFLCFSSLLILSSSSPSPTTITLSLSPIHCSSLNRWDYISHIAKSTLNRVNHLKNPQKNPPSVLHTTESENFPLYARSYGGYSVSLSFGTPPQNIPLLFDTGSSLLWVPCTKNYTCINCAFNGVDPSNIPTFDPELSSTARILGCQNPKCGWLFGPDVQARCSGCSGPNLSNCTRACPEYILQYGRGATEGVAVLDTLDLPREAVPGFLFGCSVISAGQPEGIVGFGRAPTSVPIQLKLKKFSYCLVSHQFDDKNKSSNLTLTGAGKCSGDGGVSHVRYTPFTKNPVNPPYDEYYYITLRRITVGEKPVKLPSKYLLPGPDGSGGAIVDSGTTLTFMDQALFEPLVAEFVAQTGHLKRAQDVEAQSGFGLCYNVSDSDRNVSFPELVFHFKGGAKMKLPSANYLSFVDDSGSVCLTILSDSSPVGPSVPVGPAIIMGNYLQQNFYVEYDLENQKFGFKKHKCG